MHDVLIGSFASALSNANAVSNRTKEHNPIIFQTFLPQRRGGAAAKCISLTSVWQAMSNDG